MVKYGARLANSLMIGVAFVPGMNPIENRAGSRPASRVRRCSADAAASKRSRVLEELLPRRGQRRATPVTFEQLRAEITLQRADLPAERWLRHVQELCGANEAEFPRDGHEVTQPP